ncbi:MAG: ATP synthase F0 subunit B [Cyanobacteria bacterium REEB65]|nr:ATP synthase F0 subunit B [Cyanobacteria bacterium REEB65]
MDHSIASKSMKAHNLVHVVGETVINAIKIPFSRLSLINEDRLLDLIEELEGALPAELQRAEELLAERDKVLAEARRQADEIVGQARSQAQHLVAESSVLKAAMAEAERIRQELDLEQQRQQAGADRYADEVLADLESKLSRALSTVQNGRQSLGTP